MKLPRDLNGDELAASLSCLGYRIIHQTGSHQRLYALVRNHPHSITIPRHKPLRIGTLHGILKDVAEHHGITLEKLKKELFG
jgi:predicted RNA binding protein YcfA (HicA-like mRNA interferase family)